MVAHRRFAIAENRDCFEADSNKYAPRYGGYCALAVSRGHTASVDPENVSNILNDGLYLNYNDEI
jgi:hypothetical protein